ncbi:esterase [Jeotgalibacillus malaysiensis]|uniref:Putative 2-succinyl-6-hydroxy-2,4-cyclohexadiene-1-carboxylate synthase n=1 Tax=Jeotgalibacillus malaysiensis TaxID=1508404 RepID=A0A0B5AT54_9BACL|nr:2-succinyl-6-hydroxy-2,4-cyclohexadiene-1-carboxylate synthase [Jeotgalibacillus malaysiensis]AJD91867.1 esterase [Jeotgalibacillus malaysiensis]
MNVNGESYHVEVEGSGTPVVLLHGFTGSTKSWSRMMRAFKHEFQLIAIDLPGHGQTKVSQSEKYEMEQACNAIKSILDQLNINKTAVIGYSMGGRTALAFAHLYPERVSCLILESASPGLKTAAERAARQKSDKELAAFIESEGVERFTDRWEQVPLFDSQKLLSAEKRQEIRAGRLKNSETGLALSLRYMGTGSQKSYWDRLKTMTMPVLLLTGEWDRKFINIADEMIKLLPNAVHHNILSTGHAIQVEQPEKFDTMVREFLNENSTT